MRPRLLFPLRRKGRSDAPLCAGNRNHPGNRTPSRRTNASAIRHETLFRCSRDTGLDGRDRAARTESFRRKCARLSLVPTHVDEGTLLGPTRTLRSERVALLHVSRNSRKVIDLPVRLNVPSSGPRTARARNRATSFTSTSSTGSLPSPDAMCSPPSCERSSHVSRSGVSSRRPLIGPGRTLVSRSPMIWCRRRSLSALLRL